MCLCRVLLWFSLIVCEIISAVEYFGCGRFVNHLLGFVSCKMFGRSKRPLVLAFQNTNWSMPSVLSETVFLSFEICFLRSVWDNAYKRLFPKLSLILNGFPFVNHLELGGFYCPFVIFRFWFVVVWSCILFIWFLRIWNVRFVSFLL